MIECEGCSAAAAKARRRTSSSHQPPSARTRARNSPLEPSRSKKVISCAPPPELRRYLSVEPIAPFSPATAHRAQRISRMSRSIVRRATRVPRGAVASTLSAARTVSSQTRGSPSGARQRVVPAPMASLSRAAGDGPKASVNNPGSAVATTDVPGSGTARASDRRTQADNQRDDGYAAIRRKRHD
jgi:hypothetical protein